MQLGLLVIPANNEELEAAMKALQGLAGVSVLNAAGSAADTTTTDELEGTDDLDDLDDLGTIEPEKLHEPTADELKARLTEVRDGKGVEMLKEILTSFGATNLKTLEKSDWAATYAAAGEMLGLNGGSDDGFGDLDDLDDLGGGDVPDAETTKLLCQKYAKKYGKEKATKVLEDAGLNSVRGLKASTDEQRGKIYAVVKEMEG